MASYDDLAFAGRHATARGVASRYCSFCLETRVVPSANEDECPQCGGILDPPAALAGGGNDASGGGGGGGGLDDDDDAPGGGGGGGIGAILLGALAEAAGAAPPADRSRPE